jgi:hypothetical protein
MSEHIVFKDCVPDESTAAALSSKILMDLKLAIGIFDEPMFWHSADGLSMLQAEPMYHTEKDKEVRYGKLKEMPMWQFAQSMNVWILQRATALPEDGSIRIERFLLHAAHTIGAAAVGSLAVIEEGAQGEFANNSLNDDLNRAMDEPSDATIKDYANLMNATFDLKPIIEQKHDEHTQYILNMTKEDKRNYRAMKRDWIIKPELDKKAAPKYWGITYGSSVWLVRASSADEAVLDLEDQFDTGMEPLFMCFADPYDDNTQAELSTKFPDGNIKRLIPYSIVEWPNEPDNMTEEQQAAFNILRRD